MRREIVTVMFMAMILVTFSPQAPAQGRGGGGGKPKEPSYPANPAIVAMGPDCCAGSDLVVMNPDGSDPAAILGGFNSDPSWAPDGEWIAFSGGHPTGRGKNADPGDPGIHIIHRDGSGMRKVASDDADLAVQRPAWSPETPDDGQWIAYIRVETSAVDFGEVRLVRATRVADSFEFDSDHPLSLENAGYRMNPRYLSWSPDGSRLAVSVSDESVPNLQSEYVFIVDLGFTSGECGTVTPPCSTGETLLADIPGNEALPSAHRVPAWSKVSPNWIALAASPDPSTPWDIYAVDTRGDAGGCPYPIVNLTGSPEEGEHHPAWSADDTQVVFDRSGDILSTTLLWNSTQECLNPAQIVPQFLAEGQRADWVR